MRRISMLSVGVLSLSLGCSGPTSATVASAVSGSWVRVEAHPGSDFEMSLVANGTSLSGTGNFVAEAGPGGTMTIEGGVTRDTVNLDFTFSTEFTDGNVTSTGHFTGILSLGALRGNATYFSGSDITTDATTFVRKH